LASASLFAVTPTPPEGTPIDEIRRPARLPPRRSVRPVYVVRLLLAAGRPHSHRESRRPGDLRRRAAGPAHAFGLDPYHTEQSWSGVEITGRWPLDPPMAERPQPDAIGVEGACDCHDSEAGFRERARREVTLARSLGEHGGSRVPSSQNPASIAATNRLERLPPRCAGETCLAVRLDGRSRPLIKTSSPPPVRYVTERTRSDQRS
jgi:hypothetical protein